MDGLVREAETIISETKEGTMTRDAALIIAAQKVEHYEIASYGGLVQLAITMQLSRVADILEKTLTEEEDTDQLLPRLLPSPISIWKRKTKVSIPGKRKKLKSRKQQKPDHNW